MRSVLSNEGHGTNISNLNQDILQRLELRLPPIGTQRKIAAILSAYDDLIENNNRRIKLLEEMAQRIYREWFVDCRYPGHHDVPLRESELGRIPEGWAVRRLDAVADVVDCLHSKKPDAAEDGAGILLQLFNIGEAGVLDLSNRYMIRSDDYERWTSRIELVAGDCVITNVGRIAAVAQVPPGVKAAPGRNMTGVRPRDVPPTYLLEYFLSDHMKREVQVKKDAGSIMDSLNVKGIVKLLVPVPAGGLAELFELAARPIRREIEVLIEAQARQRMTRDLLLPRLISGEVDVTNLDIAMPQAAA
jgi:type I restriction enzyme S subunit